MTAAVRLVAVGVAIIVVIGLFVAFGSGDSKNRSTQPTSKWTDASGAVSEAGVFAPDLVAAYKANEVAADARYKDKTIAVTGDVESIGKDLIGSPYVMSPLM